tara:strand:+ start:196 stop:582 length:387 start_codon:yes stop_codon:yes gene_type:complete
MSIFDVKITARISPKTLCEIALTIDKAMEEGYASDPEALAVGLNPKATQNIQTQIYYQTQNNTIDGEVEFTCPLWATVLVSSMIVFRGNHGHDTLRAIEGWEPFLEGAASAIAEYKNEKNSFDASMEG